MPATNRREISTPALAGYFDAALSELPRGALHIKTHGTKRQHDSCCSKPATPLLIVLGSLALPCHACHVTVRFKGLHMRALFECLRAAFAEDHLVADVVITLRIAFQLSLGRRYHRCRARCVVVA